MKNIKNTILMLATIGFPVIPVVGVPLFMLAIIFKFKNFYAELVKCKTSNSLLSVFSIFYILISLTVASEYPDLLFSIKLLIKIWLSYLSGIFVAVLILENYRIVLYWLLVQMILIFSSSFIEPVYFVLLNFMSTASRETFEHVFGLRGLGFGVYHVDGALSLSFFALLSLLTAHGKIRMNFINYLSILASVLLARSSILMSLLVMFFKKPILLILSITFFLIVSPNVTDEFGPIFHAFELFRNIAQEGSFSTTSTNANLEMIVWPHDILNYYYGYGYYFDGGGLFFMNTDLGWFRVLLFGGVFYLVIFCLLNIIPLFVRELNLFQKMFLLILFFVINFKGIMILPFYIMVLRVLVKKH